MSRPVSAEQPLPAPTRWTSQLNVDEGLNRKSVPALADSAARHKGHQLSAALCGPEPAQIRVRRAAGRSWK